MKMGKVGLLISIALYDVVVVPACICSMMYWYILTVLSLRGTSTPVRVRFRSGLWLVRVVVRIRVTVGGAALHLRRDVLVRPHRPVSEGHVTITTCC